MILIAFYWNLKWKGFGTLYIQQPSNIIFYILKSHHSKEIITIILLYIY